MKKTIFSFFVIMFTALLLNAQALYFVGGYVTNLNGGAINNHTVYVWTDSSSSFSYYNTVATNSNGYYSLSIANLPSSGTLVTFHVATYDCQNAIHESNITNANPQNTVSFSICNGDSTSCQASFTYTPSTSNPYEIHFHDQSTGTPTSWTWTILDGSGTTVTGSDPVHTFSAPGSYGVSLTITTASGCTSTIWDTVVVSTGGTTTSCQAGFTFYPDTLNGTINNYHFTNTSTSTYTGNTITYSWSFGDGTSSTDMNPTHQYATSGTYNVCLTMKVLSNDSVGAIVCDNSSCSTIQIGNNTNSCQNSFTYTNTNLTYTFLGSINSTDSTSYHWYFGDGSTANDKNVTHTFTQPASGTSGYTVCLVTETIDSSSNVCHDTTCQSITINTTGGTLIQGYVYAGNDIAHSGYVQLYQALDSSMSYNLFATIALDSLGYYAYNYVSVPPVTPSFIIKASLNTSSPQYANYFPTYFVQTLNWYNAATVTPSSNTEFHYIYLVAVPTNPTGNGTIGGSVSGNGKSTSVSGAEVILMDASNNPLAVKFTDANGNYSFINLAMGTYKIVVEIVGENCTVVSITLSSGNPIANSTNFIVNGANITASVEESQWFSNHISDIYPNPSNGNASIDFSLLKSNKISIKIFNNLGQLMLINENEYSVGSHKVILNTNQLSVGIYTIQIIADNSARIIKKFVKTK